MTNNSLTPRTMKEIIKKYRLAQKISILLALGTFLCLHQSPCFAFDVPDIGEGKCYGNCGNGGGSNWGGGNWGGGQVYYVPTGPSPQELERRRKARASINSNNKGVEYHNRSDYRQAIKFYREALRINPNNATARENLRRAKQELQWQKERRATEANNRGVAYHNRGDYETAIKFYKEALRIDPYDSVTRENLRKAEEALKWQRQRQLSIEANNKGVKYANSGDYEKAIELYKKALKIAPYDDITKENLRSAKQALKWKHDLAKYLESAPGAEAPESGRPTKGYKVLSFIDPSTLHRKKDTLTIKAVPPPRVPSSNQINSSYVDTAFTQWPRIEAAVVFAKDVKERAKVELAHFLKTQGLAQAYRATIGKYRVVQISTALGENLEAIRKGQQGLREDLLNQAFTKMDRVLVIGSQARDDVDLESEWKDFFTSGEKTLDQTADSIEESIGRSLQGWWNNRVPESGTEKGGTIRPLQFNRGEGMEYKRLKPDLRLDEKWSKYLSYVR